MQKEQPNSKIPDRELLQRIVERVTVHTNELEITFRGNEDGDEAGDPTCLSIPHPEPSAQERDHACAHRSGNHRFPSRLQRRSRSAYFTATPRHSKRQLFSWTVYDYPLKQAIIDSVVKRPLKGIAKGIIEQRLPPGRSFAAGM
jgi:hypothetical protein